MVELLVQLGAKIAAMSIVSVIKNILVVATVICVRYSFKLDHK